MKKLLILFALFFFLKNIFAQKVSAESIAKMKLEKILAFLNLTERDSIADIGTGNGYSLVPIAASNPLLTFTVEDIDSNTLNVKKLAYQIKNNGNKARIEQFKIVYGTEISTNLPSTSFNKILVFDVIHELSNKKEILDEIKRVLQKKGTVFIEEILVHKTQKKDWVCSYPFLTEEAFLLLMKTNNFILKKEDIITDTGRNKYIKLFEYSLSD